MVRKDVCEANYFLSYTPETSAAWKYDEIQVGTSTGVLVLAEFAASFHFNR